MSDERVTCTACHHYRSGWCLMAQAAGLSSSRSRAEIGRDFSKVPQHCSAHKPRAAA
ncbi:MAG: hypothetical protein RLZZ373_2630 [Pseudomonadota bacterium]|jgi:hypothetical protein